MCSRGGVRWLVDETGGAEVVGCYILEKSMESTMGRASFHAYIVVSEGGTIVPRRHGLWQALVLQTRCTPIMAHPRQPRGTHAPILNWPLGS